MLPLTLGYEWLAAEAIAMDARINTDIHEVNTLDEVGEILRSGKTKVYEEINDGRLKARKLGRKTVVLGDDLREYIEELPNMVVSNKPDDHPQPQHRASDDSDADWERVICPPPARDSSRAATRRPSAKK
jgi:excisionase family DNA binding protein